jgi:hypothetical protein
VLTLSNNAAPIRTLSRRRVVTMSLYSSRAIAQHSRTPGSTFQCADGSLIGDDAWLSDQSRAVRQWVQALADDLAAKPYESLEPLAAVLVAAQD